MRLKDLQHICKGNVAILEEGSAKELYNSYLCIDNLKLEDWEREVASVSPCIFDYDCPAIEITLKK